jgi:hypothetical protein
MNKIYNAYKVIEKPLNYLIVAGLIIFTLIKLQNVNVQFHSANLNFIKVSFTVLLLILSVLNWYIEVKKWQILKSISFISAIKTVFNGLVANIFIPAGVGDISLRTISDNSYKDNFYKSLNNSLAQFLPTVTFGVISLVLLPILPKYNNYKIIAILTIAIVTSIYLFFSKNNLKLYILAYLRYFVFMVQCYLLFYIFSINTIPFDDIGKYVAVFFMLRSIIPSFLFAELGIRASLAVIIFSAFEADLGNIILVFSVLLLVNNYLPALIYKTIGVTWLQKLSLS